MMNGKHVKGNIRRREHFRQREKQVSVQMSVGSKVSVGSDSNAQGNLEEKMISYKISQGTRR